jgi:hypothetical protein
MLAEKRATRECAYRVARPRGLPDVPTTAKNAECSTHPDRPRALIRLHSPRVSPSWTRVFGPMEATTRALRLASARTKTQCFEIELTQRALDLRDLDDGEASLVDGFATGRDFGVARIGRTAAGDATGSGADWTTARSLSGAGWTPGLDGRALSRAMLPGLAIIVRPDGDCGRLWAVDGASLAVSAGAIARRGAPVSTVVAGVSAPSDAPVRESAVIFVSLSRRTKAVITMAANATAPTPFQT